MERSSSKDRKQQQASAIFPWNPVSEKGSSAVTPMSALRSASWRRRSALYYGDEKGAFYHPTALIKEFRSFAKLYDIRDVRGNLATYYCLRHTFATTLLQNGVDAKTAASLMGHSSVAETLNTYASTDPSAKAAAGQVVERIMAER